MDPVSAAIQILGALFTAFGKPALEAALSHHGYVPRRVEAVIGPDDSGHASEAADELRGKAPGNMGTPGPDGGQSHRGCIEPGSLADAGTEIRRLIDDSSRRYGEAGERYSSERRRNSSCPACRGG